MTEADRCRSCRYPQLRRRRLACRPASICARGAERGRASWPSSFRPSRKATISTRFWTASTVCWSPARPATSIPRSTAQQATDADGPFDPPATPPALPLIRRAIDRAIPLLAICRGIQELNVALGGTLASEIQDQPGIWDHRKPDGCRPRRHVRDPPERLRQGRLLHCRSSSASGEIKVNSLHRQAIAEDGAAPARWKRSPKTARSRPSR